jgi:hypothetical protein
MVVGDVNFALASFDCVDVRSVANILEINMKVPCQWHCAHPHGAKTQEQTQNFKVNMFPMNGNQFIHTCHLKFLWGAVDLNTKIGKS